MTQVCRPAKCIEAIRVALIDQCTFAPVPGAMNGYAMGCLRDVSWTPDVEAGEESVLKSDCGDLCWPPDVQCDRTKKWDLEFKIAGPDPEFLALIEGNPLIVDTGVSIGVREVAYSCSPYLFVELWERTDGCEGDGDAIYFRHIFPAIRLKQTGNEKEGVFRTPSIEGKTTSVVTTTIGNGPYDDIPVAYTSGAPATEKTDYIWFEDTDPPVVACGAIAVPVQA